MIRATAATATAAKSAAAATLALALAGCATPSRNNDVVAVVQDEPARQAVVDAVKDGKSAEQALSKASDASEPTPETPR